MIVIAAIPTKTLEFCVCNEGLSVCLQIHVDSYHLFTDSREKAYIYSISSAGVCSSPTTCNVQLTSARSARTVSQASSASRPTGS